MQAMPPMSRRMSARVRHAAKGLSFEIMRKVLGRGDLVEVAPVPLRKRLQLVPSPHCGREVSRCSG